MAFCSRAILFCFMAAAIVASVSAVHEDDARITRGDFTAIFPANLAAVLKRVADAKSIPYAAMISGMLMLACTFSYSSWCTGVAGNVEPLMLFSKNMGRSGINKTGACQYFEFIFKAVRRALVSLSNDPQTCIDNGVHVSKVLIPALDNTGTQAALIQRHSKTPNLFGSHDEWASVKRQAANGASGAIEIGFQHVLKAYNGPVCIENELKGGAERCLVPRINTLAGIQPSLAKADLGEGTPLYHVGLTSRQLWFNLVGNFDKVEVREPLKEDEQTVFEYVVAIAARAHVVQGEWFESKNSEKLKAEFMGTSKGASLSALEEASLEFYVHSFDPDFMGSGLGQTLEQVKKVKQLNLQAEHERIKATSRGEAVAGRWANDYEFEPCDEGTGPFLPKDLVEAGFQRLRVFEFEGEARQLMTTEVLTIEKALSEMPEDSGMKNIGGKAVGQITRLAGAMQTIAVASQDVDKFLGKGALGHGSQVLEFILNVSSWQDAIKPDSSEVVHWAVGTEYASRIPEQFVEPVSLDSVNRAKAVLHLSHRVVREVLLEDHSGHDSLNQTGHGQSLLSGQHVSATQELTGPMIVSSRVGALLKAAFMHQFVLAPVAEVLSGAGFRVRASKKGANVASSELPLLIDIQNSGLLAVLARGNVTTKKFFLRKIAFSDMNQEQKYQLCSRLADLGVTMDEYRANAVVGKNDVALESIGGAFQGALPFGLLPYEIPSMFATQEIEQPAPTQERQGGDEGSDNEDANKENSNNMEGDGDEAEAREKRSRPDPV